MEKLNNAKRLKPVMDEIIDLLVSKGLDYGDSLAVCAAVIQCLFSSSGANEALIRRFVKNSEEYWIDVAKLEASLDKNSPKDDHA
jgi:hypothetical protein